MNKTYYWKHSCSKISCLDELLSWLADAGYFSVPICINTLLILIIG